MDMRLTRDKMKTFDGHEKIGVLTVSAKLTEMGELQNAANEVLAANINDLIRRVCALEDKAERDDEIFKKIAAELSGFKKELDRIRLTEKLNSGAIERLDRAMRLAQGDTD